MLCPTEFGFILQRLRSQGSSNGENIVRHILEKSQRKTLGLSEGNVLG